MASQRNKKQPKQPNFNNKSTKNNKKQNKTQYQCPICNHIQNHMGKCSHQHCHGMIYTQHTVKIKILNKNKQQPKIPPMRHNISNLIQTNPMASNNTTPQSTGGTIINNNNALNKINEQPTGNKDIDEDIDIINIPTPISDPQIDNSSYKSDNYFAGIISDKSETIQPEDIQQQYNEVLTLNNQLIKKINDMESLHHIELNKASKQMLAFQDRYNSIVNENTQRIENQIQFDQNMEQSANPQQSPTDHNDQRQPINKFQNSKTQTQTYNTKSPSLLLYNDSININGIQSTTNQQVINKNIKPTITQFGTNPNDPNQSRLSTVSEEILNPPIVSNITAPPKNVNGTIKLDTNTYNRIKNNVKPLPVPFTTHISPSLRQIRSKHGIIKFVDTLHDTTDNNVVVRYVLFGTTGKVKKDRLLPVTQLLKNVFIHDNYKRLSFIYNLDYFVANPPQLPEKIPTLLYMFISDMDIQYKHDKNGIHPLNNKCPPMQPATTINTSHTRIGNYLNQQQFIKRPPSFAPTQPPLSMLNIDEIFTPSSGNNEPNTTADNYIYKLYNKEPSEVTFTISNEYKIFQDIDQLIDQHQLMSCVDLQIKLPTQDMNYDPIQAETLALQLTKNYMQYLPPSEIVLTGKSFVQIWREQHADNLNKIIVNMVKNSTKKKDKHDCNITYSGLPSDDRLFDAAAKFLHWANLKKIPQHQLYEIWYVEVMKNPAKNLIYNRPDLRDNQNLMTLLVALNEIYPSESRLDTLMIQYNKFGHKLGETPYQTCTRFVLLIEKIIKERCFTNTFVLRNQPGKFCVRLPPKEDLWETLERSITHIKLRELFSDVYPDLPLYHIGYTCVALCELWRRKMTIGNHSIHLKHDKSWGEIGTFQSYSSSLKSEKQKRRSDSYKSDDKYGKNTRKKDSPYQSTRFKQFKQRRNDRRTDRNNRRSKSDKYESVRQSTRNYNNRNRKSNRRSTYTKYNDSNKSYKKSKNGKKCVCCNQYENKCKGANNGPNQCQGGTEIRKKYMVKNGLKCTFCFSKDHIYDDCPRAKKHNAAKKSNKPKQYLQTSTTSTNPTPNDDNTAVTNDNVISEPISDRPSSTPSYDYYSSNEYSSNHSGSDSRYDSDEYPRN